YSDLSHDRKHDYVFSFDRILGDRGNTAFYLLCVLSRVRSIIQKVNLDRSVTEIGQQLSQNGSFTLEHASEIRLAKFVLMFTDVIVEIVDTLEPHTLCKYLLELTTIFSELKMNQESEVNLSRVVLCEATARIMETGLYNSLKMVVSSN